MKLKTPTQLQSDINRLKAHRNQLGKRGLFTQEQVNYLTKVYNTQLRQLNYKLEKAKKTKEYINSIKVNNPETIMPNGTL